METWHCSCDKCVYTNPSSRCDVCVNFSNFERKPEPDKRPEEKPAVAVPRLIDANALLEEIDEEIEVCQPETTPSNKFISIGLKTARKDINRMPTVDAVPVKRGHWITTQKTIDDNITTCSNCKREFYIEDLVAVGNEGDYCEFCPSCGADMLGETEENQ